MIKFLVIDQHKRGDGDEWINVYDTLTAANNAADVDWSYLTNAEKAKRHIFVAAVDGSPKYLNDWAFGEDGIVDFKAYHSYDIPAGAFDSDRL